MACPLASFFTSRQEMTEPGISCSCLMSTPGSVISERGMIAVEWRDVLIIRPCFGLKATIIPFISPLFTSLTVFISLPAKVYSKPIFAKSRKLINPIHYNSSESGLSP